MKAGERRSESYRECKQGKEEGIEGERPKEDSSRVKAEFTLTLEPVICPLPVIAAPILKLQRSCVFGTASQSQQVLQP